MLWWRFFFLFFSYFFFYFAKNGKNGYVRDIKSIEYFTGGKGMDLFEGGIRVPGIIRWPKKISPKTEIDIPTSLLDFRATIEDLISINSLVRNSTWSYQTQFLSIRCYVGLGLTYNFGNLNLDIIFPYRDLQMMVLVTCLHFLESLHQRTCSLEF